MSTPNPALFKIQVYHIELNPLNWRDNMLLKETVRSPRRYYISRVYAFLR